MSTVIRSERDGPVQTIWLDGPDRRNALGEAAWQALAEEVVSATDSEASKLIVLRGKGGIFSAGADISDFPALTTDTVAASRYFGALEAAMLAIESAPIPVLAAIEGFCIGASVAVALCCDIRIASPASRFAVPPAKLGLVYPYRDTKRLADAVGLQAARRLLLTGATIDATEALRIGLIDIATGDEFEDMLQSLIADIVACSPASLRTTKRALSDIAAGRSTDEAGYPERLLEVVSGGDFQEGLRAYQERRRPRFLS